MRFFWGFKPAEFNSRNFSPDNFVPDNFTPTYFFRKIVIKLINKKMEVMWNEDEEMLNHRDKKNEKNSLQCIAPTFNLEEIKENNFFKIMEDNFNPEFIVDVEKKI